MAKLDTKTQRKEEAAAERHLWVRLTNICNNNCVFCLDKESRDGSVVPLDELKKDFARGISGGATRLILSGGEATLHPDFFEIVRYGKSLNYRRIQVVTNGRMFAYKDFLDSAIEAGLGEITFSIHGHNAKLHDAQTRIPGSFDQALAGLVNAIESSRLIVNVDIVISKFNYRVVDKIMDYFIKLGVHEFDLLHVTPFGDAWKNREKVFYDPAEGIKHLNKAFGYSRRDNLFVWTNRFPPAYLSDFPELVQNPLKIKDEVRGRMDLLEDILAGKARIPCRDSRCKFCFLQGFCNDLFKTKKEVDDKSIKTLRIQAGDLSNAKLFLNDGLKKLIVHGDAVDEINITPAGFPPDAALSFHLEDFTGFDKLRKRLPNKKVEAFASNPDLLTPILHIPGVRVFLELNADNEIIIIDQMGRLHKDKVGLYAKNRNSLAESRELDVDMPAFFDIAGTKKFKTSNIPACLAPAAAKQPWAVSFGVFDKNLKIDPQKLADDFILNHYYIFPAACGGCAKKPRCPGVHVNYFRSFGFKPKPFEKKVL